MVTIFWKFTIFYCRLKSPQVKRNLISSITNFIYKLPHKLPNENLRKLGNLGKISNLS